MNLISKAAVALLLSTVVCAPAFADPGTKVALVPGGPHPYFAAWEQAGADAMKEFNLGAGDYRVPAKWELNLQSQLLESLLTQGDNSFLIFPGDAVGTTSVAQELVDNGGQVIATAGCLKDPSPALFCLGTDTGNSIRGPSAHQALFGIRSTMGRGRLMSSSSSPPPALSPTGRCRGCERSPRRWPEPLGQTGCRCGLSPLSPMIR